LVGVEFVQQVPFSKPSRSSVPSTETSRTRHQITNKIAMPIVTLPSDATTTRINIPWIFRRGPGDADQAQLIATDIYRRRNLRKVLLIAEDDHDGRVGAEEFLRAANLLRRT
jgi:hypothetical protein